MAHVRGSTGFYGRRRGPRTLCGPCEAAVKLGQADGGGRRFPREVEKNYDSLLTH